MNFLSLDNNKNKRDGTL